METTDYLAVYGALLSSVVFVWTVLNSRPKVDVKLTFAIEGKGKNALHGVGVSVQNPSARTVHISNLSFMYKYKKQSVRDFMSDLIRFKRMPKALGWVSSSFSNHGVEDGCPVTIEPGKSHWVFVPDEKVQELLARGVTQTLKVVAQDALWRNKYSNELSYNIRSGK